MLNIKEKKLYVSCKLYRLYSVHNMRTQLGLYGLFDFNLVSWIFQGPRTAGAITLYIIIAIAALWLIISPIITGWGLRLSRHDDMREERAHR